jgi:hypothetical protein
LGALERRRRFGRAVSSSASATAAGPVPACTESGASTSASTAWSSTVAGWRWRRARGGAAAARFAALDPAAQRAWLSDHWGDLLAGRVALSELPGGAPVATAGTTPEARR